MIGPARSVFKGERETERERERERERKRERVISYPSLANDGLFSSRLFSAASAP